MSLATSRREIAIALKSLGKYLWFPRRNIAWFRFRRWAPFLFWPHILLMLSVGAFWLSKTTDFRGYVASPSRYEAVYLRPEDWNDPGAVGERSRSFFEDGAICNHWAPIISDDPNITRSMPNDAVIPVLDSKHSTALVLVSTRTLPADKDHNTHTTYACDSVIPGSASDELSHWRRSYGIVLSKTIFRIPPVTTAIAIVLASIAVSLALMLGSIAGLVVAGIPQAVWFAAKPIPRGQPWPNEGHCAPVNALLMLSDLHVSETIPYEIERNPGLWTSSRLSELSTSRRLSCLLRQICCMSERGDVVIAGDITDLGLEAEWSIARSLFAAARIERLEMVPGNHDVSVYRDDRVTSITDPRHIIEERRMRASASLRLIAEICGRPVGFPRKEDVIAGQSVPVLLLDSNQFEARHLLSNAIGLIGSHQLEWTKAQLQHLSGPVLVVLHHHLTFKDGKDSFMVALDSRQLLSILHDYIERNRSMNSVLVLHGHKHRTFREVHRGPRETTVHIYGHPSSTLGEESATLDGQLRYAAVWFDHGWHVTSVTIKGLSDVPLVAS